MNRIEQVREVVDDILKDADVMQHCLYNPLQPIKERNRVRYERLLVEFGIHS